jgi:hypothetical protein
LVQSFLSGGFVWVLVQRGELCHRRLLALSYLQQNKKTSTTEDTKVYEGFGSARQIVPPAAFGSQQESTPYHLH